MPPNPRVLVPLGLGGVEAGLDGSQGLGSQPPPPPPLKLTTRKTIILMGSAQTEASLHSGTILGRDHSRLEDH
ncbi:Hypothetical protein FKW44_018112 [Caligus rogercresseyi]|uniref:Uncharacterized protein n=1 Tax=Caligus rogercresseyi TaxID=217165 RepID=A0A7T8JWJ6_CALRO|nr:Hypothetical protein FKW44_018112 [Caligus rogercresseyi]